MDIQFLGLERDTVSGDCPTGLQMISIETNFAYSTLLIIPKWIL